MKINKKDFEGKLIHQDEEGITFLSRFENKGNGVLALNLYGYTKYKPDNNRMTLKTTGSHLSPEKNTLIRAKITEKKLTGLWNISNKMRLRAVAKDRRFKANELAAVTIFSNKNEISVKPANIQFDDPEPSKTYESLGPFPEDCGSNKSCNHFKKKVSSLEDP
ncbi:MAG: hypothetical protein JSW08_02485 [archaeon]|nr:MAG: hypothetical protein JSW08_02485 [archaeon]